MVLVLEEILHVKLQRSAWRIGGKFEERHTVASRDKGRVTGRGTILERAGRDRFTGILHRQLNLLPAIVRVSIILLHGGDTERNLVDDVLHGVRYPVGKHPLLAVDILRHLRRDRQTLEKDISAVEVTQGIIDLPVVAGTDPGAGEVGYILATPLMHLADILHWHIDEACELRAVGKRQRLHTLQ